MARLSAVNPNRVGVVHRDGEGRELSSVITDRFARREEKVRLKRPPAFEEGDSQSRIKATDQRLARVAEGGLSSGMVFLVELEGDCVSGLGNNGAGLERENTGTTDDNAMIGASAGSGGRRRVCDDRGRGGSGLWRSGSGLRRSGSRRYHWGCRGRRIAAGHCLRFESGELVSWVHGEDHSLLTMICLAAVHPNRLSITDEEPSGGEGPTHVVGGDWYAARFVGQGTFHVTKRRTDNPESKPPELWQGLPKVDWVTV